MTPEMLRQLLKVAEARKSRDLAALDALNARARACEAEAREAARMRAADMEDTANSELPLAFQGLRMVYVDQRIADAEQRLKALAPEIKAARTAAAASLGKHAALERLIEEAERNRAELRAARAERDAPPAEVSDPG